MGRPAKYESDEELQKAIDSYFVWIKGVKDERLPEPPTVTGLALALGFESRQSFYDYELKPEFSYTIKRARLRVENEYEKNLSGNNCTGSIFVLKNLGWKDKTEVATDMNVNIKPSWFDSQSPTTTTEQVKSE